MTGTPNPILQVPIGQVLKNTYTPTPVYVLTPHAGYGSYNTAIDAYQRGDFETMLTYIQQTANQLETADIVFLVGEAYRNLQRYNEAYEAYERALFVDSAFAPAYFGKAQVLPYLDPEYDPKQDLDQAILLDPDFGQVYIERAKYYLDQESYQLAFEDADQAVVLLPLSHLAHYYRAASLLELKDYQEAEKSILTSLSLDINYIPSYLIAGRVSLETGKPDQALDLLTRYEPYDQEKGWKFYYALGRAVFMTGGDLGEAEQLLNQAQESGGNTADFYQTRALIRNELGNVTGAINDARKARSIDKDDFAVNLLLGKLYFQTDQVTLAEIYLKNAGDLAVDDPDLAEVYYYRALAYEALGNLDGSISDWNSLLELPLEVVPDDWELIAAEKLLPTATMTPSLTPSATNTFTPTGTFTSTPTKTITPRPSSTQTPSATPSTTTTID
jgi:tetratricopeptide (TPR) repeat protein